MTIASWAARYCERFGFALCALEGKVPIGTAWNTDARLIRDPDRALGYWSANPHHGVGVCLEPSRLVSLDIDNEPASRAVLTAEGLDLDELVQRQPTIQGRGIRLEFTAPDVPLSRRVLRWPKEDEPGKEYTVLELRAGRVQDVLPPSMHPTTCKPYAWLTRPTNGFPPLPPQVLALWQAWPDFERRAKALCPWRPPAKEPEGQAAARREPYTGTSVIAAFNDAHDLPKLLERHGYKRVGNRWLSPHSTTGVPGVVMREGGRQVIAFSGSDPLNDGRPHDAFDLYALFDHGGARRAAVKAAAQMLGIQSAPAYSKPR